jgi:hypothetical protein
LNCWKRVVIVAAAQITGRISGADNRQKESKKLCRKRIVRCKTTIVILQQSVREWRKEDFMDLVLHACLHLSFALAGELDRGRRGQRRESKPMSYLPGLISPQHWWRPVQKAGPLSGFNGMKTKTLQSLQSLQSCSIATPELAMYNFPGTAADRKSHGEVRQGISAMGWADGLNPCECL